MKMARVGILSENSAAEYRWRHGLNVFGQYVAEILNHAGVPFEWLTEMHHIAEKTFDILIVAVMPNDEPALEQIWQYAECGGTIVSFAGLGGLADRLGFQKASFKGNGYAVLPDGFAHTEPLRFLHALPWMPKTIGAEDESCKEYGKLSREPGGDGTGFSALQVFPVGDGAIERWNVDVVGTIVGLQQGEGPILEDGIPAPDGTANVNDGILKADDGICMDWQLDRERTAAGALYFSRPYADLWRETIIGRLLRSAQAAGKTLPFVDYWPDGVPGVAMISHDSDRNQDGDAFATLELLQECGINSTWCMMKAGYSPHIYSHIRQAGHELALHFNAKVREGGKWEKADFRRQHAWLLEATGAGSVVSNKNHFTRFEGWGDLFRWCEECGIQSDQSRGPSKSGNVGFLFGTCQPYFPIAWSDEQNRLYDVLEIGFLTQDIPSMTDTSVVEPFLQQVKRVRGVAHFLFHQGRLHDGADIRDGMRHVVREARKEGFLFWTGAEINAWVRNRRATKIAGVQPDGNLTVKHGEASESGTGQLVYWRPVLESEPIQAGEITEQRFGVMCKKVKGVAYG